MSPLCSAAAFCTVNIHKQSIVGVEYALLHVEHKHNNMLLKLVSLVLVLVLLVVVVL